MFKRAKSYKEHDLEHIRSHVVLYFGYWPETDLNVRHNVSTSYISIIQVDFFQLGFPVLLRFINNNIDKHQYFGYHSNAQSSIIDIIGF